VKIKEYGSLCQWGVNIKSDHSEVFKDVCVTWSGGSCDRQPSHSVLRRDLTCNLVHVDGMSEELFSKPQYWSAGRTQLVHMIAGSGLNCYTPTEGTMDKPHSLIARGSLPLHSNCLYTIFRLLISYLFTSLVSAVPFVPDNFNPIKAFRRGVLDVQRPDSFAAGLGVG